MGDVTPRYASNDPTALRRRAEKAERERDIAEAEVERLREERAELSAQLDALLAEIARLDPFDVREGGSRWVT